MKDDKKPRGRPMMADRSKLRKPRMVRFNDEEYQQASRAAQKAGLSFSAFVRGVLAKQ